MLIRVLKFKNTIEGSYKYLPTNNFARLFVSRYLGTIEKGIWKGIIKDEIGKLF